MTGTPNRRLAFGFCFLLLSLLAPAQVPQEGAEQLKTLATALADDGTDSAYARLAEFARKNAGNESGAQAALALGHADHNRRRYDAAMKWYVQAEKSEVLCEYALLFGARAARSRGREDQAIALYERLRRDFPSSVQDAAALEEMADAALAVGQARKAIEALEGYAPAGSSPELLLVRARALHQLGRMEPAAADYAAIYYGFPLSPEARTADAMLSSLRRALGAKFPSIPVEKQAARAEALFGGNRCTEARAEFTGLLPRLTGAARDRAQLRIARCRVRAGAPISVLSQLKIEDPETDAERLYALSQTYRARRQISAMLKAVEDVVTRYPQSRWTEDALYSTGNYYWVELDRAKAAEYYDQVARKFPFGRNAVAAHWRVTWTTYLERPEQAAAKFEGHLTRYRTSTAYTENALYWLGRLAERAGDEPRARAFYTKAAERFTQSYYGRQAADRLNQMGAGSTAEVELLNQIPKATPAPTFADAAPAAAEPHRNRAFALMALAMEKYAEQELRAAYSLTRAPRLLLEAAQAAHQAQRHGVGITIARRVDPFLDSRRVVEAPEEIWRAVYPLPYQESIETTAERKGLDPMIVAGLIRQESTFLSDAVSRAGAVGLMQVMPRTGRVLARRERVPYSRSRLFQPEYNLRLGITHLADLIRNYGSLEKALAAYNAGPHRVAAWTANGGYSEPAEFVESIPFSETREYVQIVMRNAEIYRRLYASSEAGGGQ